jgi:hypothetical protein
VTCEISFVHDLPLNKSNADLRVNFFMYSEFGPDGSRRKHFAWVTDLTITEENATILVEGGRARWKIENEAFNTLKNQGYHFEHNYGHGQQNLSVVFAMLMMGRSWWIRFRSTAAPYSRQTSKRPEADEPFGNVFVPTSTILSFRRCASFSKRCCMTA